MADEDNPIGVSPIGTVPIGPKPVDSGTSVVVGNGPPACIPFIASMGILTVRVFGIGGESEESEDSGANPIGTSAIGTVPIGPRP